MCYISSNGTRLACSYKIKTLPHTSFFENRTFFVLKKLNDFKYTVRYPYPLLKTGYKLELQLSLKNIEKMLKN